MPPEPLILDARALAGAMRRFDDALRAHREELDSLNVFPVPDGDTGTNLLLTQEAVIRALDALEADGLPAVGEAIARASLMGARGNSGVILSQVLRGLTQVLRAVEAPDAKDLARGLGHARDEAYRAVAEPKPGTMLDILDAATAAASEAAERGGAEALATTAGAALEAARAALEETRERNPELARAGVVDAGGKGLLLMLDAVAAEVTGAASTVSVGPLGPVGRAGMELAPVPLGFELEVMYILEAPDQAIAGARSALGRVGDSVVVVGGEGVFSVHVHTDDRDAAVAVGRAAGRVRDVRVTSLADQVAEQCMAAQARAVRVAEDQTAALVAVAEGEGFVRLFHSLGALVVPGGASSNPSVEELLAAIEGTGSDHVLLLPNHPNVTPAATAAAELAHRSVRVVPTRSMPEGIAASTSFHPLAPAAESEAAMVAGLAAGTSGALTPAARPARTEAGPVSPGDWLATHDSRVVAAGPDLPQMAVELVGRMTATGDPEIVSLYVGFDATADEAAGVERALARAFPDLELEVHAGGQPVHPYLIGVE